MGYFPFFMEMQGKKGIVVGGGKIAARKVEKLLLFGPILTVIAPAIEACVRMQGELSQKDAAASLRFEERVFRIEDLKGADFVIAATDDTALNGQIADYCRAERIPVNVVDDREKCTFFFPALCKEGPLTIGISTDGQSPVAASWVRQQIAEMLPKGIGNTVDLLGQIRPAVMQIEMDETARKHLFERMFYFCMERGGAVKQEEVQDFLRVALQNGVSKI